MIHLAYRQVPSRSVSTLSTTLLDERWRNVLSEDDLRKFHALGEQANARYGYV